MQTPRPHPRPLLLALVMVLLGLVGIMSLLPALPSIPGVPRVALLVNPTILLAIFAVVGAYLAPRAGLSSRIADRLRGIGTPLATRSDLTALGIGILLGMAIAAADQALAPLWQQRPGFPPSVLQAWSPLGLVVGMLYGGIVEEITMRWGLMSLLVWTGWRLFARRRSQPPPPVIMAAVILAALVFAVGHLPVLIASGIELTGPLVTRTVAFNAIAGLAFGWLYASRDLESAMIAHAGFHVGAAVAALTAAQL